METRKRVTPIAVVTILLLFLVAPPSATAADVVAEISNVSTAAGNALQGSKDLLSRPTTISNTLPTLPLQTLIDATSALSTELGYSQDVATQIRAANLSPLLAGRLANIAVDLLACHRITEAHFDAIEDRIAEVAEDGDGLDPATFNDIDACAQELWSSTNDLSISADAGLVQAPSATGELDIWPVIRVAGMGSNVYLNDYLFQVDFAGTDTYINNAGSNMVDPNFSPPGALAVGVRGTGPSRGCQMAIGTPGVGGLANGDCVPTAAVLLDMGGSDTYGGKQTPDIDAKCTAEPVIRRMVTVGVGFLGVGILLDSSGTDKYTGKTVTIGSGHVFGTGILDDRGGNDTYSAVRNAQGFSLIHALGVLHDESGSDRYDFYLPAPLDPSAPNETDGAGGVVDDVGACDNRLRFNEGGGNVGGIGLLLEDSGRDTYIGGFSDDFLAPAGQGRGGSQGFGNNTGFGILFDRGGDDTYTIVNQVGSQGAPERDDGVTIGPDPTCQNSTCSGGVFIDRR